MSFRGRNPEGSRKENKPVLVVMRLGVTPVPIPNTMVKTQAADGTWLETARESRWLPEHFQLMTSCNTKGNTTEEPVEQERGQTNL